jgi:membrane protein DedA with SNARE-associated domain
MLTQYADAIQLFMSEHVFLAMVIIFLIATGEALFIIGLFLPSTVVLVGAGALVGAGKLPFAEVFAATVVGAIVGDAISYWVGRRWGEQLLSFPLVRDYPEAIARGRAYFARNGEWSVFFGRFVPGVKAIVPGVAGIMGMSARRFTVVNVVSAFFWAAAHILPGLGLGYGLEAAGGLESWWVIGSIGGAIILYYVLYKLLRA